jgi:uncharacterized protein DUF6660
MSIIVLGFSWIPCADTYSDADHEVTITKNINDSSSDHQHDDSDSCSPFCHCSCCAGFSANYSVASLPVINFAARAEYSSFLPQNVLEISLPVWQPPQIIA